MFGSIGMPELIIIFTVALIVFGPRKLPELGRSLGKSLQEFRRASNELKHTLDEEISLEERTAERPKALPAPEVPRAPEVLTDAAVPTASEIPTDSAALPSPAAPETIARGQHQF